MTEKFESRPPGAVQTGTAGLARGSSLAPTAPLGFAVVGAWVALAWLNGGYPPTRWGPIGIGMCLALLLAFVFQPLSLRDLGRARILAVACMAAFAVLSYLSILWAKAPGDAWTGADRTLVPVVAFLVFASWRWPARTATAIVAVFVLAIGASAVVELIRLAAASHPVRLFDDGRLIGPIGYVNGTVALWMLAFWPAVHLGSTRVGPSWLRPLCLAAASALLDLCVLGESRAWIPAFALSAVLAFALARQRMRWLLGSALAGAGTIVILPFLLEVFEHRERADFPSVVDRAVVASLVAILGVALATAAWVVLERRVVLSAVQHRRLAVAVSVLVVAGIAASAAIGVARVGNPASFAQEKWQDFAHSYTFGEQGSRFGGSLSGQRYEEWRVAWDQFLDHPVLGAGVDNFAGAYLAERNDNFHDPRHPHSLPLRLLAGTGLVGTLCFVVGLGAAAVAALGMRRRLHPLFGGLVAACVAACAYWLLQGAVDVLLEIPALGAIALGLLGLASSIRGDEAGTPERTASDREPRTWSLAAIGGAGVVLLSVSIMLALPWLSTMYVSSATRAWRTDPGLAYDRLERAASLAPLSADPLEVEGSIALRRGDHARARTAFRRALARDPSSWYAHLELGLLEAAVGARAVARNELAASLRLNPNERVTRLAWRLVRRRARIDPGVLNRTFVDPSFRPPGLESYTHDVQTPP